MPRSSTPRFVVDRPVSGIGQDVDVIVVGAGTAGMPAAIEAAGRGLRVALVEAGAEIGGTLRLSTASISAAGTSIQAANGIEDSADRHYRDCLRINHGTGDPVLLRRWTEDAAETVEWLLSIGWSCTPDGPVFAPEHDLYDVPRTYRSSKLGFSLIEAFAPKLDEAFAAGRIVPHLSTRFRDLIVEDGRVTGIVAERDGETVRLHAKAVILTTGGFSGSARHWQELHGLVPIRYHIDTVVGDAIDPVCAAGGGLWFENYVLPAFGATRDIGSPASAWIHSFVLPSKRPPWEVYVNARGERFMAEDEPSIDARERALMAQPGWTFWSIYDEAIRRAAPPLFQWPPEKVETMFAGGEEDYVRADSIAELAYRCGLPADTLAASIDLFNRGQRVGSDQRRRQHMPLPIGEGPFYAVRHYGCSISSYPGLRVDEALQVLRTDGSPIEGLHAAGEVIGIGFLGHGFLSGSIVSSAITFGRRLGRTVLA